VADVELHGEVDEWTEGLSDEEWDRVVIVVDRLAALGSSARMPLSRALGDGLFELRFTLGSTARRITYRFTQDGRIVLLTTFRKQRNNERNEIDRARRAAADCARRNP
jgi:putative component of toxin-antitoxin plasmid stabilization module